MALNPVDDQSYTYTADLLAGPLFFGAIGYGVDRWIIGAGNRWVVVGLIIGIVMGLYAVFVRYRRTIAAIERQERARRQAIQEAHPRAGDPVSEVAAADKCTHPDKRTNGVGTGHRD